jgi:peptide/nickel transport system permease protein
MKTEIISVEETYAQRIWRRFQRDSFAFTGLCIVAVLFVLAALAPLLANSHAIVRVADGRLSFPVFRSLEPIEWRFLVYVSFAGIVYLTRGTLMRAPRLDLGMILFLAIVILVASRILPRHLTVGIPYLYWFSFHVSGLVWFLILAAIALNLLRKHFRSAVKPPQINFTFVLLFIVAVETCLYIGHPFNDPTNDRDRPASFKIMPPIPYSAIETSPDQLVPPSWKHPCGTDSTGRDIAARMLHGARTSLAIGFVSQLIALCVGVPIGGIAGYYRGWIDIVICRFIEVMECFPTFLLVLVIIGLSDAQNNMIVIMSVIGLTGWIGTARLIRGEFLRLAGQPFTQAALALGAGDFRIIVRHLLPNSLGPVLVTATFGVASAILIESSLSFLGFGMQAPTPSWGDLLSEARKYIDFAWWLAFFPGLAILLTIMSYNFVGEGLRDAVDPRLRVK